MTMVAAGTNAQPGNGLRVALVVIAAIATAGAMMDFPIAFHDFGHKQPLLVFAQRVTAAKLMLAPLIAGAALALTAIGRVRLAIAALAALMLTAWLSELPTIPLHGLELSLTGPGLFIAVERLVVPLLAVAAIFFAMRNTHLWLANVFVTVPLVMTALGVTLFAIGVAI